MPSMFAKLFIVPAVAAVLLIGAPAFAQSQPPSSIDPFSGVTAVDSEQMSAVSGEFAAGISAGISTHIGTGDCGALCDSGAQSGAVGATTRAVGATTRDVSASGNTIRINVTAINIQTSIVGPGVINTSGGSNSASGGGAN